METIITIIILLVTLMFGVPIPLCFGASVIWFCLSMGYDPTMLLPYGYNKMGSVVLLCIPMFILAGGIMEKGNIGSALVNFVEKFIGRIKGSLAYVAIITSALFGAISGSGAATLSCIGSILAPKMRDANYPLGKTAAILAASAPLGLLIPPSALQIMYAFVGNQSVLACFLSTVIPGIIVTILLCIVSWFLLKDEPSVPDGVQENLKDWSLDLKVKTVKAIPALVMPGIILGGIYGGFMTPTEAAAVVVLYTIPVGMFIYKGLTLKGLWKVFVDSATTTGVIMVMLFTVNMLCRIFIMENLPTTIMNLLLSVSDNKYVILMMINLFLIIVGMLIDDTSGILLCTPILLPTILELGVHPVHFAAIIGVNLGMGNITPPTAPFLYLSSRITKANVPDMLVPTVKLIAFAWLPTLLLTTYVPEIALFLPRLILGQNFG